MSEFENFLDLENYGIAVLTDEEGNEIEVEKIAIVPFEEKLYAVLTPVLGEDEEAEEEIEIAIFEIEDVEGEVSLTLVDDEDTCGEIMATLIAGEDEGAEEGEEA